uniref:NDR1/HIN1-like protein 3 n=1 Tax=Erigeron canadensis TaxID=72917 RepID=UPI001CB947DD|nr:NDR1/HIN1-like protein 3 [Erigeron canadensis]
MTVLPENDDQPKYHPLPQKPDDHDPKQQLKTGDRKKQQRTIECWEWVFISVMIFVILVLVLFYITLMTYLSFIDFSNDPEFHVDDVTPTQFELSPTNNTLYYNLDVNMTFRNPNNKFGIHYDKIRANVMYHGQRLMTKHVQGFYLGHKMNNNVNLSVKGQQLLVLLENGVDEKEFYESESRNGVYEIDLKLRIKMRLTTTLSWEFFNSRHFNSRVVCHLKIPLISSQDSKVEFERTHCVYKQW